MQRISPESELPSKGPSLKPVSKQLSLRSDDDINQLIEAYTSQFGNVQTKESAKGEPTKEKLSSSIGSSFDARQRNQHFSQSHRFAEHVERASAKRNSTAKAYQNFIDHKNQRFNVISHAKGAPKVTSPVASQGVPNPAREVETAKTQQDETDAAYQLRRSRIEDPTVAPSSHALTSVNTSEHEVRASRLQSNSKNRVTSEGQSGAKTRSANRAWDGKQVLVPPTSAFTDADGQPVEVVQSKLFTANANLVRQVLGSELSLPSHETLSRGVPINNATDAAQQQLRSNHFYSHF